MPYVNWNHIGEVATAAQLTGLDSVKIIALIVQAASNARMHRKNCKQFAQHLKLIGNLLAQLKLSDLKEWPETREPLEELEEALRRAYILVDSCKDKSYLYLLALGWTTVARFKESQAEIDRLLGLVPLISLVDKNRERYQAIEKDKRVYTLDEEELKVHETVLKPEITVKDARILEKSLSRSYPGLSLDEVLKKESSKLKVELQNVEENLEMGHADVIQHLIDVTENILPQRNGSKNSHSSSKRISRNVEVKKEILETSQDHLAERCYAHEQSELEASGSPGRQDATLSSSFTPKHDEKGPNSVNMWHNELLDCCMDPHLCLSTCMYPCGTFSDIAAFASNGKVSSEDACSDCMTYSLMLSCCCYTCCYRRKLRRRFNIEGGCVEDLCTHVLCFYCALVQEWREVLERDGEDIAISPPPSQTMEKDG